eukprot:gene6362-6855_t
MFLPAIAKPFLLVLLVVVALEFVLIITNIEVHPLTSEPDGSFSFRKEEISPSEPYLWESRQLSSSNDDFTYTNPSDTYSPSQYVQYGHKFTGMKFAVNMKYAERLLYAPIVTFGLGFIAISLTLLGLLFRCCVDSCRCLPNTESVHYERDRLCLTIFYIILALLVLIIDQLVFLGNQSIDQGVKLFRDDINSIDNLLNLMTSDTNTLYTYSETLNTEYTLAKNSCQTNNIQGHEGEIQEFQDSMKTVLDSLNSVSDKVSLVNDYIDTYAIFYRTIGLYVIWGLAIVCVICFLFAKFCESIGFTKFTITISTITYLLFIILGFPWLLMTSAGGDLCMDPSYNIIKSIPIDSVKNISTYYSTCQGASILQVDLNQGLSSMTQLNDSLTLLLRPPAVPGQNCPGDKNVEAMQSTVGSIDLTADDLEGLLACAPIQYLWFDVVNEGLCRYLYQGVFYIWGSQLVTSFLLFILIVIASLLYQYYEVGKIAPDDEEGEDEERGKVVLVKAKPKDDDEEDI